MTAPKKSGRRTKLSPEVRERILEASRLGMTRDLQARYAGVGKSTLLRWFAEGRKQKRGMLRDLWDAVKEAEGLGAARALASIHQASGSDWKAAAWFLERRHGYRKNGPAEIAKEEESDSALGLDRIGRLDLRISKVNRAIGDALRSGSFQAAFRGIHILEGLEESLELAKLQGGEDDGLDDMSSPQFQQAFAHAAEDWPDPLLEVVIRVYERRHGLRMLGVG